MRLTLAAVVIVLLLLTGCSGPAAAPVEVRVDELIAQLESRSCRFSSLYGEACLVRGAGMLDRMLERVPERYRCPLGAAQCLERLGPKATAAVPALLRALRQGPNDYDTGDGVIPVRSAIASALAATGDPRAIDALAEALRSAAPLERSAGALASDRKAARPALLDGLARFGQAAGSHWELAAAVLRERNADRGWIEAQRVSFDRSRALSAASAEIRRKNPGATSFTIDQQSQNAALAALDRTSPEYLRDFEAASTDALAGRAAAALGSFGRREAIPVLLETLGNPAAALGALQALRQLKAEGPEWQAGLRRIVQDPQFGPAVKAAARRQM